MTTTYVAIAESGITHDGQHYPKAAQVQWDAQSAGDHPRHGSVRPLDTGSARRKGTIKQGEKE